MAASSAGANDTATGITEDKRAFLVEIGAESYPEIGDLLHQDIRTCLKKPSSFSKLKTEVALQPSACKQLLDPLSFHRY